MVFRTTLMLAVLSLNSALVVAAEPPSPGTTLNATNIADYAEFIDETLVRLISEG